MINLMSNKTNGPHKSFWSFILTLILVFGLFQGFLPKNALATNFENNYIDNLLFYYDTTDDLIFQFHCKTTFTPYIGYYTYIFNTSYGGSYAIADPYFDNIEEAIDPDLTSGQFKAGTTYRILGKFLGGENYPFSGYITKAYWEQHKGAPMTSGDNLISYRFLSSIVADYTILAYYDPSCNPPSLTITYPVDNAEIVENFYVTGTFTQPTPTYSWLTMFVSAVGGESYIDVFNQNINFATSGPMSIYVSGLSAGYYDFDIYMRDLEDNFYPPQVGWPITNIHIVNNLPPALPPYGGQPPITAPSVFDILTPAPWYASNSPYETSTALFDTLTGTFAPVLLAIGDNLTQFAQNFTASNASSTGNQLGNSILLVRSYITNINSFFADFPVGQFLLLYLIALVVVIVLRLVKGLIGLFKI